VREHDKDVLEFQQKFTYYVLLILQSLFQVFRKDAGDDNAYFEKLCLTLIFIFFIHHLQFTLPRFLLVVGELSRVLAAIGCVRPFDLIIDQVAKDQC
jgi:glucan phosphoethanolaminetransferase (alkaline phosphatase superfamily)